MGYEDDFGLRLSRLRSQKNVSARKMSLALGQNKGYINTIERGRSMPSMAIFYDICDYLEISPADFFSNDKEYPAQLNRIMEYAECLTDQQLDNIAVLMKNLVEGNKP